MLLSSLALLASELMPCLLVYLLSTISYQPITLTTKWQRFRVVLPQQLWPCLIVPPGTYPKGAQQNAWDAPLYGRGQPWPCEYLREYRWHTDSL